VVVERLSDPAVEAATEHALERYAGLLEPNPRAMKRFVNAFAAEEAAARDGVTALLAEPAVREVLAHLTPDDIRRCVAGRVPAAGPAAAR
jgi:hypothetical protein